MALPRISVVVPSHNRAVRLRWLLNALEEQTLEPEHFEIVVADDSAGTDTDAVVREHPLTASGRLRLVKLPPDTRSPGANRNAGWHEARAKLVAFIDDDCRASDRWLEALLDAYDGRDDLVLQGPTRPDPFEAELTRNPFARTLTVEPPHWYAQSCNIAYPRTLLERLDGFDETPRSPGGEDTDLFLRSEAVGARMQAVPDAVVFHAVEPQTYLQHLRFLPRWQNIPYVFGRHPRMRRHMFLGVFWRRRHATLLLAGAGLLGVRGPLRAVLVLPWALEAMPPYGSRPHQRLHALVGLPARALIDAVEIGVMAKGSLRYRTFFL